MTGQVAGIARYPVKSMTGEMLTEAPLNAHGLVGDRLYAFESSAAPPGMLRLSGRERRAMLGYSARTNETGEVEVKTPAGELFAVESAGLISNMQAEMGEAGRLRLTRSDEPQTDVRPLSLISLATITELSEEIGQALDARRFRANLLIDLEAGAFAEDALCGQMLHVGETATVLIRERDPRCRFITYDPAAPLAGEPLFDLMKLLHRGHQGRAGVYASVVTPGQICRGDAIRPVDSREIGESKAR